MKKLLIKDNKLRNFVKYYNKKYFLLKLIIKNKNIFILTRYKAIIMLKFLIDSYFSIVSISNRCVITYNKKKFNKNSFYARSVFLKKIQNGEIVGLRKSSW